jgi:histidine decarboxylase
MNRKQPTLADVINSAVGPFEHYCMGYMSPGGANGIGYIATMKLSVGTVSVKRLDAGTEGIVSYDRCEKNDAYIGQINMLTASSFCGITGALWGYHLAKADEIAGGLMQPIYYETDANTRLPVYTADPLLDATQRLFGVDKERRFNPLPGSMIVCANKSYTSSAHEAKKGCWVWCSIAIAIARDPTGDANLFIEDAGSLPGNLTQAQVDKKLLKSIRAVTRSVVLCGRDQSVHYSAIYVSTRNLYVPPNNVGCALACAPYVILAQKAIPGGAQPADLANMTITQWEQAVVPSAR